MSNQRYSPEFKDESVRQIIERGHSVSDYISNGLMAGNDPTETCRNSS